ncbi:cytochrome c oxidase assembly protein [Ferrovibrio xuzhouensis]|uniref:Cytochrome c oxidase assembly protein n=1 Tax=Ferrovibrio xuzhouensis TaxID=1576914 RepID=A0ABV7VA71_9PROT
MPLLVLLTAWPAFAHGGEDLTEATAWTAWDLTPDIVIPTLLVAACYIAGLLRRANAAQPVPAWRHVAFFAGLAAVFIALQSPVDPVAERLFFVHQIQHLLLRMIGPMLIALAWPQGILTAGLPAGARRTVLVPVMTNRSVQAVFGFLAHPVVAMATFIVSLYAWEVPRWHNAALLNDGIHYLMHVTMLVAGLLFWWLVLDRRPPPQGLRHGMRLMMLWLAILSNIILGGYTALKHDVLYTAYDTLGRLYGLSAITDEHIGGIIIWIPSSMMCLIAILLVIHMWGRHETLLDERRQAGLPGPRGSAPVPTTAAALVAQTRPKNRALALSVVAFAACVFATVFLIAVLDTLPAHRPGHGELHAAMPADRTRLH